VYKIERHATSTTTRMGLTRMVGKMGAASDIKGLALLCYMEDLLRQRKSIKRVREQVSKYNDTKLKLNLGAYKLGRMWSIAINRAVVKQDTHACV
jgi:hypothetical protein